ncbi:MAG: EAL domain-containing protein [Kineosporiaceae bacterium]
MLDAVLSSLSAHVAVLDGDGVIVAANAPWIDFDATRQSVLGDSSTRRVDPLVPGANYLFVCRAAAESGQPGAQAAGEIAHGVAEVLAGRLPQFSKQFPYRGPDGEQLWFELTVVTLTDRPGAIVTRADVTARTLTIEALAHQASHDPLTGLPNRTGLRERLHTLVPGADSGPRACLLFIDLDGFKAVNDGLGHGAGDDVLVEASRRLREAAGRGPVIGRLGGDEFAVLLPSVQPEVGVAAAARIVEAFTEPFDVAGLRLTVTASVGVAVADAAHQAPADLMRDADAAMYRAKEGGRSRYAVFDSELRDGAMRRLQVLDRLRQALAAPDDFGLSLAYQPLVTMADRSLCGVEALSRWLDPVLGRVTPPEFIGVAEDSGLIVKVGTWALTRACSQVREQEGLSLSVNVSPRQLADARILTVVDEALRDSGLPPQRLCLEITESAVMADLDTAVARLSRLRDRGVHIALDDFGTGWSSLGQLRRLPVDKLKVDRVFVDALGRDDSSTAVVTAIVALAQGLGMSVTAEGVETEDQYSRLRDLGVDDAQGYLLGRPGSLEDLATAPVTQPADAPAAPSGVPAQRRDVVTGPSHLPGH